MLVTSILGFGSVATYVAAMVLTKELIFHFDFVFPLVLSCAYFGLVWVVLFLSGRTGLLTRATNMEWRVRWAMSLYSVASTVAMNYNLKRNSFGIFQLSRLCVIPCALMYEMLLLGNTRSLLRMLPFVIVFLLGCCYFAVNDLDFTWNGLLVALLDIGLTSICETHMLLMSSISKCSELAMTEAVSFPRFVMTFVAMCALEAHGEDSFFEHYYELREVRWMGVIALVYIVESFVNVGLVGKVGPVLQQMLLYVKVIITLVIGIPLFPPVDEPRETKERKIRGLVVSITGLVAYTCYNYFDAGKSPTYVNKFEIAADDMTMTVNNE